MRILFDHQTFTFQPWGGISRLFAELLREFSTCDSIETALSLKYSTNEYLKSADIYQHKDIFPKVDAKWKTMLTKILNQRASIKTLRSDTFDIFHPTYYDPYFLRTIKKHPFVLTVFDMTQERLGQGASFLESLVIKKELLTHKADRIIAISENTKQDLVDLFGIDETKIDVVPLATSLTLPKENPQEGQMLPANYLLYVGGRQLYKNFQFFVKAMAPLLNEYDDLSLVCAGGGEFNRHELLLLKELSIDKKVQHSHISSNQTLAAFYQNAKVFLFPSLYEGFGIPLLEAFACECPIVSSNAASLPEVAGDAAIYFEPESAEQLKKATVSVLENEDTRNRLIKAGSERIKQFSWKKTAEQTIQTYEKALEQQK